MTDTHKKLGTFDGVFTPSILTIIGVILFLRLGWVVGNVGFIGALIIILLAHVATISTGLAMSSMATNTKIGAGGFYSILSRSLGLEIGGAIGIPLYLSQALGVSLYIVGFTEAVSALLPDVSEHLISFSLLVGLFILSYVGVNTALKVQYFIMAIIAISLVSFFGGHGDTANNHFLFNNSTDVPFWTVFAIFFPAVTGISAGASLSGDLKNPKKSLPIGILSAIGLGLAIYISVAYWFARQATPEQLINNTFLMRDISLWSYAIIAGVIGATLSSALGSILAAPRILMALGEDRVLPFSRIWSERSKNGEPHYSLLFTVIIIAISIFFGDLNTIAPLLTMFFLITYGMINIAVFIEKSIGITSFRPSFNIPLIIPFIGGIWCFITMFLINYIFASIALLIIVVVYIIQIKRGLLTPWGDVRGALFNAIAEWAAKTAQKMPHTAKAWKPNLLIPIEKPKTWISIISLIKDIAFPKGSLRLFSIKLVDQKSIEDAISDNSKEELEKDLNELAATVKKEGIFTSTTVVESSNFMEGLNTIIQFSKGMYFFPNIIFLTMSSDSSKGDKLQQMIKISAKEKLGIIVLGLHPKSGFGRREVVNLWLRDKSPNQNLATLMAVELQREWGAVRLVRITETECNIEKERQDLERIVEEGRMPTRTELVVLCGKFNEVAKQAPLADINIFGMSENMSQESMHNIVEMMETSCLFAMDSGNECILS
ncbi:MAG: amino acid permease [Vampirovibrionia bacterium]